MTTELSGMQLLVRHLAPQQFPELEGSVAQTEGEVNARLYAALRAIIQNRLGRADEELNSLVERLDQSSRFSRVMFVEGRDKQIFYIDKDIEDFFAKETGVRLAIKRFIKKEKVQWLCDYWHELAAVREHNPALPAGEIVARTEEYLLSLQFEGGNLCYDVPGTALEAIATQAVDILRETNRSLIPFTRDTMRKIGINMYSKSYGERLRESLKQLARMMRWGDGITLLRSLPKADMIDARVYAGEELVPFTDLKTANILLPASGSLERFIHDHQYHIVDADKMDRNITYAHNLAHIFYDPSWNLPWETRERLLREEGLLTPEREVSTRLSVFYYLTRQVALLSRGPSQPYADWNVVEKRRYKRFYKSLRTECEKSELDIPFVAALKALPEQAPAWELEPEHHCDAAEVVELQ